MDLKDVSTVDLVKEVLARAENIDALSELLNGVRRIDAGPPTKPQVKLNGQPTRGATRLSVHALRKSMGEIGRPATVEEIARKCRASSSLASAHLCRGFARGEIQRIGDHRPFLYALVEKAS